MAAGGDSLVLPAMARDGGHTPQGEHPGGTLESPTSRRSASTVTTQNQTVPLASMTGVRFVVVRGGLIPSELSAAGHTARMA